MGKHLFRTIWLALLLMMALTVQGQTFRNDFENGYNWYPPWTNLRIVADTILEEQPGTDTLTFDTLINRRCECGPDQEFGMGFSYAFPDSLQGRNLHLAFQADYRFPDTLVEGQLVFTIKQAGQYVLWKGLDLKPYANDSADWFQVSVELNLPADHLIGNTIHFYLWNNRQRHILIDNASVTLTPWTMPSFLPKIQRPDSITEDHFVIRQNDSLHTPLTYPIGLVEEYILEGDTFCEFHLFSMTATQPMAVTGIDTTIVALLPRNGKPVLVPTSRFFKDCLLLRQALVVPFVDSTLTLYRRNGAVDTDWFQSEYYLDREGFKIGEGERSIVSYHQTDISSTQFDADHRVAYFNIDYWRDHPMIHYPLSDTLEDVFEDRSHCHVYDGMEWIHFIPLQIGTDVQHLPRILSIPYGYASGIVFTEHADWTDLRTHRAVLFGNEHVTKAKDAIGGFVYYGIPVTKSVFYNNPDRVSNDEISHGAFHGLHATIKTDREFERLLKQLHKLGFDLCLHTPEQYTTTPSNLQEALDYMQRRFKSTTWIDHGYNNGPMHNREDLVCDGLVQQSPSYAATQWRKHGIRYLWNAYYEENRMEPWCFDNNLTQPYPGFGDALPNRQITTLVGYDHLRGSLSPALHRSEPTFLTWCTPSTLEAATNEDWDYYYSEERLQKLVDQHSVHITHIYPAWVDPARGFWTYDDDSTLVAAPGMNRALARIASLRDDHELLPMTIKTYLDYYSSLFDVSYTVIDSNHIQLHNIGGAEIKGFTLLCSTPIRFDDNRFYEFRKADGQYYIWFTLKPYDTVTIQIE